ncbi:hypothetical protein J6590_094877 [Homalodisca vitripennis]|nr:hypothetical protein J6590_094877 [Homalodisca vitripennis]
MLTTNIATPPPRPRQSLTVRHVLSKSDKRDMKGDRFLKTRCRQCAKEKKLAARYNARVLNLGGIGRKFFTRHVQHLTMRGKRLLARMIVRVASERPLKTAGAPDLAIPTHISYAEALRKYPVLDSGDKSGSAAAVPRGVNGAQAASMSPGGGVLAGATEASEYISPTIRQTDSQSIFLGSPLFGKGLS